MKSADRVRKAAARLARAARQFVLCSEAADDATRQLSAALVAIAVTPGGENDGQLAEKAALARRVFARTESWRARAAKAFMEAVHATPLKFQPGKKRISVEVRGQPYARVWICCELVNGVKNLVPHFERCHPRKESHDER